MSNSTLALRSHNAAIQQISGGSTRPIVSGEDIRATAEKNTKSVDNTKQIREQVEEENPAPERQNLWYPLGISLAVGLILFLALKFKILKI